MEFWAGSFDSLTWITVWHHRTEPSLACSLIRRIQERSVSDWVTGKERNKICIEKFVLGKFWNRLRLSGAFIQKRVEQFSENEKKMFKSKGFFRLFLMHSEKWASIGQFYAIQLVFFLQNLKNIHNWNCNKIECCDSQLVNTPINRESSFVSRFLHHSCKFGVISS